MHNKDCQLMGVTWLLAKNRTAYIHTVSAVLRAFMLSTDGSDPQSCTLSSDGMPLAVDSSEISSHSSSNNLRAPMFLLCLLHMFLIVLSIQINQCNRLEGSTRKFKQLHFVVVVLLFCSSEYGMPSFSFVSVSMGKLECVGFSFGVFCGQIRAFGPNPRENFDVGLQ